MNDVTVDQANFLINAFDQSKSMALSVVNSYGPIILKTVNFKNLRPAGPSVLLTNSVITFYKSLVTYYILSSVSFSDIRMFANTKTGLVADFTSPHLI